MSESRTPVIVAAAAAMAGSLWAPWYAIDFGPAARGAIGAQTQALPGVMGEFARQMLTMIPTHVEATGWQAFDKADIVLVVLAVVAVVAALAGRMDVVGFAGAAAAGAVVLQMLDRPGPSELVSLKWGAWLALAGALAIAGASRMRSEQPVVATSPAPDWTKPTAPLSPEADPARSFAPF